LVALTFGVMASVITGGAIAARYRAMEGRSLLETLRIHPGVDASYPDDPWGELIGCNIEVERPLEYLQAEFKPNQVAQWVFEGMAPEAVRKLMQSCLLDGCQIERALSSSMAAAAERGTIIKPDEELVFSLSPEARSRLYAELGRFGSNHYMQYPFCYEAGSLDGWFEASGLDDVQVDKIKRLLYRRGNADCFSDVEFVLQSLPDEARRLQLIKILSRQSAVLPRLRVRSDTDIDRVLAYWGHGVRTNEIRPMLESLKRRPGGGALGIMFLLPPFARERLYTYPRINSATNAVVEDCHWTSLNFFNDVPDDRFGNPAFTTAYLLEHFRQVPKPDRYGDIVLLLNEQGNAIHSAVYLADDLVFTKNGNNNAQSWMVMRMNDLQATYASQAKMRLAVFRDTRW
jgi:hypothetical protein